MNRTARFAVALTTAAGLLTMEPLTASARTKTVLKYGAIGLGAAALYNLGQQSAHAHYHYGYAAPHYYAPVYPAYPPYPAYAYPAPAPVYTYPAYGTSFHFSYSR